MTNRWNHSYDGIGRANTFLDRVDDAAGVTDAEKTRMTGEVLFLRALYYFMLATYYGDAPLILDPPSVEDHAHLPRSPRGEIIQQILADLDRAADLLPLEYGSSDTGRATRGAALGLKARVLLYEASPLLNPENDLSKWQAAANAAKAVMDLGIYDLFPDFRVSRDLFDCGCVEGEPCRLRGFVVAAQAIPGEEGALRRDGGLLRPPDAEGTAGNEQRRHPRSTHGPSPSGRLDLL